MNEMTGELPERVTILNVGDKEVFLVGTAHISKESVEDVKTTIEAVKPDTICIELCKGRYETLTKKDAWEKMDIFKIIRQKKTALLLAQLIMGAFYRKLGEQLGVTPGAEMLEGAKQANDTGAKLVLADRQIDITLKRVWGHLGFWSKIKLMFTVILSVFISEEDVDADLIDQMKKQDQLESVLTEFAEKFPQIKRRLIDERDIYLAQQIRHAPGKKIVAVVGAGHMPGIAEHIQQDEPVDELMKLPKKNIWPKLFKWGIPALIIGVFLISIIEGKERLLENIYIWTFVNGTLSALGALIAFAHPLTIISAFVAAPMTSLNPLMAAGWVAALVQAWIKTPTVADFEDLPNATSTWKGWHSNPVLKVLLVCALANLGSAIGTWIAGSWIFASTWDTIVEFFKNIAQWVGGLF